MRQMPFVGGTGPMGIFGMSGPTTAYAEPDLRYADSALAYVEQRRRAFPISEPPVRAVSPDVVYWAQGTGAWGKLSSDGNAADVNRNFAGWFTGLDRRYGDWRIGIAAGYTTSNMSANARASNAAVESAHIGAYAGTSLGPWNLRTGAEVAMSTISTNRIIAFPGFADVAAARYGANEAQLFGEIGYGMGFGNVAAEPFGGLAFVHLRTDSFTEAGGPSALNGSGSSDNMGYTTLGARAATIYALQNGMAVVPRASLAWQHALGDVTPTAILAFAGAGSAFGIAGVPIARDAALVCAGADLRIAPETSLGFAYVGELAGNTPTSPSRATSP
jgi:outer membrane autotransporter protein